MKRSGFLCYGTSIEALFCFFLILLCSSVSADVLPGEVPENQMWTTRSFIEGVGFTTESTSLNWHVGDAGLEKLPPPLGPAFYNQLNFNFPSGSIAYANYKDSIISNGGQISEVKSFSLDTHGKSEGLYNIETQKVLTYTSQNGSHLMGAESYVLDTAGIFLLNGSDLVCVFSRSKEDLIPAFCNQVSASSKLRSATTAQVESVGAATLIGAKPAGSSPAALAYEIAVVPDSNAVSGYADAIVSTTFTVSVREGVADVDANWDPLSFGSWSLWMWNSGAVTWTAAGGTNGPGVTMIFLERRAGSDVIEVLYNTVWYRVATSSSPGPITHLLMDSNTGLSHLPSEADITIDGGGGNPDPYTITFQGATYIIDPQEINPALISTMISPGYKYHDQYTELARLNSIDTATIAGGISTFVKSFNYQSSIKCQNC